MGVREDKAGEERRAKRAKELGLIFRNSVSDEGVISFFRFVSKETRGSKKRKKKKAVQLNFGNSIHFEKLKQFPPFYSFYQHSTIEIHFSKNKA